MKRLLIAAQIVLVSGFGFIANPSMAHQDNSFLYKATMGMFEDQYDYFKTSPAYLPSFKSNTFWSQLSNLKTTTDTVFDGASVAYYLAGGQMDIGAGRAGLMLDWWSRSNPLDSTPFAGASTHKGFGEETYNDYQDRNSDTQIDYRREVYGKTDENQNNLLSDIYAVYALGGIAGFDLGAALRVNVESNNPSYAMSVAIPEHVTALHTPYNYSFAYQMRERQYEVFSNSAQREIYTVDDTASGTLSYGTTTLKAVLGGRLQTLVPGLDLVANVIPILQYTTNSFTWDYSRSGNRAPSDPNVINDFNWSINAKGANLSPLERNTPEAGESYTYYVPKTGMGVGAMVRGDYALTPAILLTAEINEELIPYTYKDTKCELTYSDRVRNFTTINQMDSRKYAYSTTWDGKGASNDFGIKLRAQFPAKGWKIGVGLNAKTFSDNFDYNEVQSTNEYFRHDAGTLNPNDSYQSVTTKETKIKHTQDNIRDTLELPIGLVFDILSNLNFQVGAKHTITIESRTASTQYIDRGTENAVTTHDDGAISSINTIPGAGTDISKTSTYSVTRSTTTNYGITWWPYEQIQVDVQHFMYLFSLNYYQCSLTIHF